MVSLIVVNYRTPKQIKLCLRSLRRYTRYEPRELIVVDNGSADASLDYLRGLPWIRLIENPGPDTSHRAALDLARAEAKGEWILILHSDLFVAREGWLTALMDRTGPYTQMVASQDRVIMPLRHPFDRLSLWWTRRKRARRWRRRGLPAKLISHCALFRVALFERYGLQFRGQERVDGVYIDCGEEIQRTCEERGLEIVWLGREELGPWMWHFEAATLNLVTGRALPLKRRLRAKRFYQRPEIRALLADDSLDR